MGVVPVQSDRPHYDAGPRCMLAERGPRAANFAWQVLETTRPFLSGSPGRLHVLDVGCGYGHTALELARHCARTVGIEPSRTLYEHATALGRAAGLDNLEFRPHGIEALEDEACYDLVVLDNVLEHLPDQSAAIRRIVRCLRPRGVVYIVVPNKLWPIEVHYRLPFLSYLPLALANRYLRLTGRGHDYTDASYAPTYFGLNRLLRACPEVSFRYVLPADLALTTMGRRLHYQFGVAALRRFPWLWPIAKVFLVIGVKV